jgi:hypothetical protein
MNSACSRIWPVAAGSWSFLNELRYLRAHDYMLPSFDRLVFVLNSEDFGEASSWLSENTHPTHQPFSSSLYILRKYLVTPAIAAKAGDNNWRAEFSWLRQRYRGPLTIVMYPTRSEMEDKKLRHDRLDVRMDDIGLQNADFIAADATPEWSINDYKDDIHATDEGTKKLAAHIVSKIPECQ